MKTEIPRCEWCGTKGPSKSARRCVRGPACGEDKANHDGLMARIRELDKRRK